MEWLDFVLVVLAVVVSFLTRNVGVVRAVQAALADGSLTSDELRQLSDILLSHASSASSVR